MQSHPGFRYALAALAVAAWVAAGFALRTGANAYLLLGVPFTLAFQLGVARRPVRELWFRPAGSAPMPIWAWAVAAAFMVLPAHEILATPAGHEVLRGWYLCAALGAVPLAASLPRLDANRRSCLWLCLASAGGIGILLCVASFAFGAHHGAALPHRILIGARSFLLYLPVCFILEEVFFRGALDAYVSQADDSTRSALYVSALWGLWHLPAVAATGRLDPFLGVVAGLLFVHMLIGRYLSFYWRHSGLLFVPAAAHALIDAVRNALLGG